ncbi:hypothetical protein JCM19379_17980 [Methyloparacoccus murrellii]
MHAKLARKLALCLLLTSPVLPHPAHAIAYWGTYGATLWNTPSGNFTNEDWQLFESALQKTLDTAPDGQPIAWSNPATKASGEFTVLKTVKRGDRDCRQVKVIGMARGLRRVTGIAFCHEDDGSWKAVSGKGRQ